MSKIIIIDYGMGNLGSIINMLKFLGYESEITSDVEKISKAAKLILPGVGAFHNGMKKIDTLGLRSLLDRKALQEKIPILGICLGMQLLTQFSEEGNVEGLGWIDAETSKFSFDMREHRIPHMGWNSVHIERDNILLKNIPVDPRFYFVHSYFVSCKNPGDIVCKTHYGIRFDSMIAHKNIFGCQFHPEKSHKFGMAILKNFAELE
jgi:imidazole glycerol-phosphate synthase subunit HisH